MKQYSIQDPNVSDTLELYLRKQFVQNGSILGCFAPKFVRNQASTQSSPNNL